jgi:hypothetical protein
MATPADEFEQKNGVTAEKMQVHLDEIRSRLPMHDIRFTLTAKGYAALGIFAPGQGPLEEPGDKGSVAGMDVSSALDLRSRATLPPSGAK